MLDLLPSEKEAIAVCITKKVGFPINPNLITLTFVSRNETNRAIGSYVSPFTTHFCIKDATKEIASFILVEMPGCCGAVISSSAYVASTRRNLGIGTILNNVRIRIAKFQGYGLLVCTDIESNIAQQQILKKNGWQKAERFRNPRTNNSIALHTIPLVSFNIK